MKPDEVPSTAYGAEQIGPRLRRRRKALGLTLKNVSVKTGLAESFISQLERGVYTGSIKTLQKLSDALGLMPGDLFDPTTGATAKVQRFDRAAAYDFGIDAHKLRLSPGAFDHLEAFLGVFEPWGSTGPEPYTHGMSEEIITVLDGTVEVTVGDDVFTLEKLDSVPFMSGVAHRVAECRGQEATVLWMMAPPSF